MFQMRTMASGTSAALMVILISTVAIFDLGFCAGKSYEVLFERAELSCDDDYITNCSVWVTKLNRTTPFVFNMRVVVLQDWVNNVTVIVKGFELKGTQYKESVVNFERPVCEMLKEKWIFPTVQPFSTFPLKCPVKAKPQSVTDMTVDMAHFPPVFPLMKWRMNVLFVVTKTRHVMGDLSIYVNIVALKKKIAKKRN